MKGVQRGWRGGVIGGYTAGCAPAYSQMPLACWQCQQGGIRGRSSWIILGKIRHGNYNKIGSGDLITSIQTTFEEWLATKVHHDLTGAAG